MKNARAKKTRAFFSNFHVNRDSLPKYHVMSTKRKADQAYPDSNDTKSDEPVKRVALDSEDDSNTASESESESELDNYSPMASSLSGDYLWRQVEKRFKNFRTEASKAQAQEYKSISSFLRDCISEPSTFADAVAAVRAFSDGALNEDFEFVFWGDGGQDACDEWGASIEDAFADDPTISEDFYEKASETEMADFLRKHNSEFEMWAQSTRMNEDAVWGILCYIKGFLPSFDLRVDERESTRGGQLSFAIVFEPKPLPTPPQTQE